MNERLSISLSADLVAWVKTYAAERQTTQSAVVSEALRRVKRSEMSRRMIVGLLEDAGKTADPVTVDELVRQVEDGRQEPLRQAVGR